MGLISTLLLIVGGVLGLVSGIMLLVAAFRVHVLWGLASLFLPFASLVFVIMNWEVAKKPFLMSLAATAIMVVGIVAAPDFPASGPVAMELQQ